MAPHERTPKRSPRYAKDEPQEFPVTCQIGTVKIGGPETDPIEANGPMEVALMLISRHDADGTYHYAIPSFDGQSVEYEVTIKSKHPGDPRDPRDEFDSQVA